jgi:hypothetical protein
MDEELILILLDLVDFSECEYDHHGNCQAHGWIVHDDNRECVQKRLKEYLAERDYII